MYMLVVCWNVSVNLSAFSSGFVMQLLFTNSDEKKIVLEIKKKKKVVY